MVDSCIVCGKLESVQPPLQIIEDVSGTVYKVCNNDVDIQERTVAADG